MKNIILFASATLGACLFFSLNSCNQKPVVDKPEPIVIDTSNQTNRAVDVRNLSSDEVFLRIPKASIEVEGLEKLDDKARKQLIDQGNWGGYKLTRTGNWMTLTEMPQNDDDAAEKTNVVEVAVFTQKESGDKSVLVIKKQVSEEDKEWEQSNGIALYAFDGKSWEDITTTLTLATTADFFKPTFDTKDITKHFIRYELSAKDPYQIKASLIYYLYAPTNKRLTETYLLDNEVFSVSWYWNGATLNLVKENFQSAK